MKKTFLHLALLFSLWAAANPTTFGYSLKDQLRRIEVAQLENKTLILILNRSNENPVEFDFQFLIPHKRNSIELVYLSHQNPVLDKDTDPIYIRSNGLRIINVLPEEAFDEIILGPCSEEEFRNPIHPEAPQPIDIFKSLRRILKPYGSFHRGLGKGEKNVILSRYKNGDDPKKKKEILQDSMLRLRQQMLNERLFSIVSYSVNGSQSAPFPILDQNHEVIRDYIVFMK